MYGLKTDWIPEERPRHLCVSDFEGATPRWCPGCGDHSVLGSLQRLLRDKQIPPENAVVVSGIGCSSRFPHYMKTYGFHGLHGRPLPIACGVKSRRPELDVFVVTGDGDCCAIGTAHWIHAIRYNMDLTIMMFDNNIYGLTKMQSSPTTPLGLHSNTHPGGAPLNPLNPLTVVLGIANASFVAQTVDWNPPHLYATLEAAHAHQGASFVRILQRCPHYMPEHFDHLQRNPDLMRLLTHEDGISVEGPAARVFGSRTEHDPSNLAAAREVAQSEEAHPVGLIYRDPDAPRYSDLTTAGLGQPAADKVRALDAELDRFAI